MIEIRNLSKRYGDRIAVDDLTCTVRPGRVTGFLGPNGAGKSTTIRAVLGLVTPTAGRALVDGVPYRRLDRPLRRVGALLDAGAVHPGRTARHHLGCLAASNDLPAVNVARALARTGLDSVADRRAGTFSLGMRQRLGIAAALLGDPEILIFDEPVNGLDPEGVHWLRQLLTKLAADGRTVLMSSHLMSEVELVADHLLVIGRGRLLADASMADFIAAAALDHVAVRTPAAAVLAGLLGEGGATVRAESPDSLAVTGLDTAAVSRIAAAHDIPVHELTHHRASLEQAYMSLTDAAVEYRTAR